MGRPSEHLSSTSRETAVIASLCNKLQFQNSGIECKRALYGAASSTGRHYHDDTNLIFTLSGAFTQIMCSRSTILAPGSLMFVPAGEFHDTDFGPRGACVFFVAIDAVWVGKRLESVKNDAYEPRITTGASRLQSFACKMYEEFKRPDSLSDLIVEGALLELLGEWFRDGKQQTRDAPGWLRSVKTLLQDSFHEPISLSDLSQAVGVHSSHISREFHRAYGQTAGEYIRKLRVDFVAEKLRNPGKDENSLADLALGAGFSSQAHMSAVFKRMIGMPPGEYRRAHGITSIR
jgi:AraC family transcriptional regulator